MGKGASASQNQILSSQQSFAQTLQQDFGTAFAGQQNILNGLTKSLQTTLAAGPSQFGFSTPETTALNTLATSQNSQEYQNARAAAGEAAAAAGGSANLPTGSQAQIQAEIAAEAAKTQSNSLLGIQEAGYKQGNANYNEAISGLNTAAETENPSPYAGAANNSLNAASSTASEIQKADAAASPWAQVGGLVGSLGGALVQGGLGALTGGASLSAGGLTPGQWSGAVTQGAANAQTLNGSEGDLIPNSVGPYGGP